MCVNWPPLIHHRVHLLRVSGVIRLSVCLDWFYFQYCSRQAEYVCLPHILCIFHIIHEAQLRRRNIPSLQQDASVVHDRKINRAFHHGRHQSAKESQADRQTRQTYLWQMFFLAPLFFFFSESTHFYSIYPFYGSLWKGKRNHIIQKVVCRAWRIRLCWQNAPFNCWACKIHYLSQGFPLSYYTHTHTHSYTL